jgi:hypothetical protein
LKYSLKRYRKFSDIFVKLLRFIKEDPKAVRPLSETFVKLYLKKSSSKKEVRWIKYELREELINNTNLTNFLNSQKNCAQMHLKLPEVIFTKPLEIQQQIRQTLQVFDGRYQSSEALI